MYDKIFSRGYINGVEPKNRVIMSPMDESLGDNSGNVSQRAVEYFCAKAKGGTAALVTSYVAVCPPELGGIAMPGQICLLNIGNELSMAHFVERVHAYGAKLCVQLHHPGRKTTAEYNDGHMPISCSSLTPSMPAGTPSCREMTVACFNNPESLSDANKEMIHKIVRAASNRADIAYQYADGRTDYDTEADALPYDIDAPTIVIEDYDYAVWTRDQTDNPANYDGKTISVKLSTADCDGMAPNELCAGRYVMVCCENDMQFTGLVCENVPAELSKAGKWILVTGTLQIKGHPLYGARGPVMACVSVRECDAPSQEVATFY